MKKLRSLGKSFIAILTFFFIISLAKVNAEITMLSYTTDPAIITAGDQFDLIVTVQDNVYSKLDFDEGFRYKFELIPKDSLAKKYFKVIDSEGDDIIFSSRGDKWYVKFKVKSLENTIPAKYTFEFKIKKIDENGEVLVEYSKDIDIEVKKEGANVVLGNIVTNPSKIRVGDDNVLIKVSVDNIGRKDAKEVKLVLGENDFLKHKFSVDNYQYIGYLNKGENKYAYFYYEVPEYAKEGLYKIPYNLTYKDEDDNTYIKKGNINVKIFHKPVLVISDSKGTSKIGGSGTLELKVKNIGEEDAENVVVRLLIDASLPFKVEDRSFYLGDLEKGEERIAKFDIKTLKDAKEGIYNIKVSIRAKGDSDENDDRIYIYSRSADFLVKGKEENKLFYLVYVVAIITIAYIIYLLYKKVRNKKINKDKGSKK